MTAGYTPTAHPHKVYHTIRNRASGVFDVHKMCTKPLSGILALLAIATPTACTSRTGSSRNPKRYQDVEEIIRAGISVITTLNIQHLESLHEMMERATGFRVRERIPDYVAAMADQIVNVDLLAEDLLERLKAGKIYALDHAQNAMEDFFTTEKLTQLRELVMEEIAFRLDRHR
jgi:two-component system, OmpR family, sensor histidine kinase KdpD